MVFMFLTKTHTLAQNKCFQNIVLRIEIQKLKCHKDHYIDSLKTLKEQPDIIPLAETWLSEDDVLMKYEQRVYQPFDSRHQENANRCSGGVAFVVNCGLECRLIPAACKIPCYQNELKIY